MPEQPAIPPVERPVDLNFGLHPTAGSGSSRPAQEPTGSPDPEWLALLERGRGGGENGADAICEAYSRGIRVGLQRAEQAEPSAHGPYLGAIHQLVYRVRELLNSHEIRRVPQQLVTAALERVEATEAELVASLQVDDRDPELANALQVATSLPRSELLPEVRRLVVERNGFRRDGPPPVDGRAQAVYDQLTTALPGTVFAFEQPDGNRVLVVVGQSISAEPWPSKHTGPVCACGYNTAGAQFIDPACRAASEASQ